MSIFIRQPNRRPFDNNNIQLSTLFVKYFSPLFKIFLIFFHKIFIFLEDCVKIYLILLLFIIFECFGRVFIAIKKENNF